MNSTTFSRLSIIVISAMIFLLTSCNYINNVKLLTGGSLDREDFVETIPFQYKKDLIVVEAVINNEEESRQFIFDTGAFDSKIESGLARELNLPTKATKSNSTAQGVTQTIDVTQLNSVILGDTKFSTISAGKLSYGEQSASKCIAPHGLIGANLLKLAHWKIDYQKKEIQFSDKPFKAGKEDIFTLAFKKPLLSGTPEIEIEIGGKTVSGVLFDVGFNGGLILPAWLSDSFPTEIEQTYFDRSTSGIFGSSTDTLISKKLDVSLGGFEMNVPVEFSSIGKALLGNDILEHFMVFIDYDKKKIKLKPQSTIEAEMPHSFIPGVLNDSLWVVDRTTDDLPFALGDTLLSINNKKPSDLFDSFCDYFFNINLIFEADSLSVIRTDNSIVRLNHLK